MSDAISETAKWARAALARKEREQAAQKTALAPTGQRWLSLEPADLEIFTPVPDLATVEYIDSLREVIARAFAIPPHLLK